MPRLRQKLSRYRAISIKCLEQDSGSVLAFLPQYVAAATGAVEGAAEDEEQVGETIDVAAGGVGQRFGGVQADHGAFGAPADSAAEVGEGGGAGAAGQDEFLEHRQVGVEGFGLIFKTGDLGVLDDFHARQAELAAEVEQVVLAIKQGGTHGVRQFFAEQDSEAGVEFVNFADGVDAQAVLGRPATVAKAGGAGIAGAGDDLRQAVALAFGFAVAHGALLEWPGLY